MSEWRTVKLGDVCSKIGSGATPSGGKEAYKGGDYSLVRSQNVLDFGFDYDGLAKIDDNQAKKLDNVTLKNNDVLLNITGDSVARACMVPYAILPARVNQHVAIIRANQSKADSHFLLYLLQSEKNRLLSMASGGATRNALTKGMLENLEVLVPPLSTQRRIASILSSLDAQIENNSRINRNLEEQAQALFKSWFVDFEPWGGTMPEDWKEVTLEDMTSKFGTGLNPRKNFVLGHGTNFYVTIKNMGDNRVYLDDKCDKVDDEAILKINKRSRLSKGDLLFSGIGTIGRVAYIDEDPVNWNTSESVFNMHPADGFSSNFIYLLLLSETFQKYVKIHAQGGVQQGIRMASLKAFSMYVPSSSCLSQFEEIVSPILSLVRKNHKENDRLATLRDTLLPKLMRGEIEV